jgi:hypothetical protein
MSTIRTLVLLVAFPAGKPLQLKHEAPWYVGYFFSPSHGQSAYWSKQTDNAVIFTGEVMDWVFVVDDNPDLSNRKRTIDAVIRGLETQRGIDFRPFDVIVLVIGASDSLRQTADTSSTVAQSEHRTHAAVLVTVETPFAFTAHEMGHAIGLGHSFGRPGFKAESWSSYGEYGHFYCIMSALAFGGVMPAYIPQAPRDGAAEYSHLGPAVNAATALARGWLHAHTYPLPGTQGEFEIRSRHWQGRDPSLAPQALDIQAPDGQNYVVEYREASDWDQGIGSPVVVVSHGKGSTADIASPNTGAATYLGRIVLPVTFGAVGDHFNGAGFGLEVVEWNPTSHTVRLMVRPGSARHENLRLTDELRELRALVAETGQTTWADGERLCMHGTWSFQRIDREQVATLEATYGLAKPPFQAIWSVDDEPLAGPSGVAALSKSVRVANPKLVPQTATRTISLRYEIEALPTGSRLRLYNQPQDESYGLRVGVELKASAGSGSAVGFVNFVGREFTYPQPFYDDRDACLGRFIDVNKRYLRFKLVLKPGWWQQIPAARRANVERVLEFLACARSVGEERHYGLGLEELRYLTGVPDMEPTLISLSDHVALVPQICNYSPPTKPFRLRDSP